MKRKISPVVIEKSSLLTKLLDHLYSPIIKSYRDKVDEVIAENYAITGIYGFWYKGIGYATDSKRHSLDRSLITKFEEIRNAIDSLDKYEQHMVQGYLIAVLNQSKNPNDYCKLLPDYFYKVIEGFYNLNNYPPSELTDHQVKLFNNRYQIILDMVGNRLGQLFVSNYCA